MSTAADMIDDLRDRLNDAGDTQVPLQTKVRFLNRGQAAMWPRIFKVVRDMSLVLINNQFEYQFPAGIGTGKVMTIEVETDATSSRFVPLVRYDIIPSLTSPTLVMLDTALPAAVGSSIRITTADRMDPFVGATYAALQGVQYTGPTGSEELPVLYAMGLATARVLDDRMDYTRYSATQVNGAVNPNDIMQVSQFWFAQFELLLDRLQMTFRHARVTAVANGVGTTHHIKLGTQFLIVRPNTYSKAPAPTFGARISTGDPNYNDLSIWQHWVQHCWVGGMGADAWVDDAMFKDGVGLDTTVHEQATLARGLVRGTGANWAMSATGIAGAEFIVFAGNLYCIQHVVAPATVSRLWTYNVATQAWATVALPAGFFSRSIATFKGKLFVAGYVAGAPRVLWATTPGTWTAALNPTGIAASAAVYAMKVYNAKLYVAFNENVWRMKDTFDKAGATVADIWDGGTVFYTANANSGSNYIDVMETHLGFLYMLSQNGHLHRTDGNNTFDIWSWDGQTWGVSLRSYDGKLFVGTYEYTDTADIGYGVLYQFTGAAVTELKRWGRQGKSTTIGQMIVYGRKLFYGAANLFGVRPGFGVAVYDSVEDGHSIFAINDDVVTYPDTTGTGGSWIVDDLVVFGGKLFCYVRGYGVFFTQSSFRDVEQGLAVFSTTSQGGVITSSQYDGGTPGLLKLWRRIIVWADLPSAATSMTVSYSLDTGLTWTAFPVVVGPLVGAANQNVFNMNNIQAAQFMWRVSFKTTDATKTPTLRSVSVAYLPQPEPNWMWTFVVPVTDKWELLDDSIVQNDTNAILAYIENLFRTQQLVTFIDVDGVEWANNGPGTLIYNINIMHYDIENPREADLRITLLEAVESY